MKIAYNPKTAAALTSAPANNDITFDLSGLSIYVKGERFKGTDTTYSVFKKHGENGGGYDGLVPVPDYNNGLFNRFLREDGTWQYIAGSSDINVYQSEDDTSDFRPVILGLTHSANLTELVDPVTGLVYVTAKIYACPSTGILYATKLYSNGKEVLTEHQSLADYVTLNTTQSITGRKTFYHLVDVTNGTKNSDSTLYTRPIIYMDSSLYMIYSDTKSHTIIRGSAIRILTSNGVDTVNILPDTVKTLAKIESDQTIKGTLLISTETTKSPLVVSSSTVVAKLNSDLLDGYHASGLFEKLENNGNNLSITIGGTKKELVVNYATQSGKLGHSIKFKNVSYLDVIFDGSKDIDLTGGIYYSLNSDYAKLLKINSTSTSTIATGVGTWTPVSGKEYVFRQKWTNSAVGGDTADLAIYLDGNLTANMCLDGYYYSLSGFKKSGSDDNYVLLGGGGHKLISDFATAGHNHDSKYLRKDTNDSTPYQYNFTKTDDHAIKVGTIRGTAVGSQTGEFIHLYERVAIGSPSGWGSRNAPTYGLATYGGAWLATDIGNVTIGGTNQLGSAWGSFNLTVGNNTDKAVIGYLNSSTNGVVIGGHNNALSAWAPLNIAGTTLYFRINETIRATIASNGNVGIGTTSPSYTLDVRGHIRATENLIVSTNNTTGGGIIFADDGDIVDLNDAFCTMRFTSGIRITNANRGGSVVHELNANGKLYNYGLYHYSYGSYDYLLTSNGDARHINNLPYAPWKEQWIDMTGYSESYWHPVVTGLPYTGYRRIKVTVQLNSGTKPSWSTHPSGFTCNLDLLVTAHGWGTTRSETICLNSTYSFADQNPVGWCQLGNASHGILLLRGGGRYLVCTDWDTSWTIYNQSITDYAGTQYAQTCGPYTSYPGIFNGSTTKNWIYAHTQGNIITDDWLSIRDYSGSYHGRSNNISGYAGEIWFGGNFHIDSQNSQKLYLNYYTSAAISIAQGGGNVGIGTDSPSYKLDVRGTTRSTDRIYANEWIQFDNWTGLYSPNNNAHFYPNNTTSYGQWQLRGNRNGYSGIHFGDSAHYMTIMDNYSDKGVYQEDWDWLWYFNARNGKFSVRTSSDFGADINLNGSVRTNSTYYGYGLYHLSYGSANYLLRSDGGAAAFTWSGQSGQPTWVWGGNSQHSYYVWNPSNFSVYKANKTDQLEAYTGSGFTGGDHFVRAIRYDSWHTRLYMGYYRDTTLQNTVHVGYSDYATRAGYLDGHGVNPDNSHPGYGARVFYSWNIGQAYNSSAGYSNGITIGSHPGDQAYGFQIVQNMWDDRTYTRRYNGGWQSWKTLAWTSDIPNVTDYYWANVKVSASPNSDTSPTFSTCYTSNWFRSSGNSGWYSQTYGGGWYMTDGSWIRSYGGHGVVAGGFYHSSYGSSEYFLTSDSGARYWPNLYDGRYLQYEGFWNGGSGQNVNDSCGMNFTYTSHGAPHHWGTTVTFEASRNSSYRLQLHGTGDNYLFFRNRSSDYGGWHSSGWKQILTNQDTYVASDGTNRGIINGAEVQSARHLLINGVTWNSNWHWSGQGGQPTWLWGSNDGSNMYVWNPSNFSVYSAGVLRNEASIGAGDTHAQALQTYFNNNYSSIKRDTLNTYYSSAYWNGSFYMGYFLSGYNSNPYGGFFVAHYNTPYYVGISYGSFNEQQIITSSTIGSQSVNYANSAGSASAVTVNSSDANSTYRMVWHSGSTLYETSGIYCNPSSKVLYAKGFYHTGYGASGYALTADGGAAFIGSMSVNYANSAGTATTASKLSTNAGSSTLPVYFSGGIPVACTGVMVKYWAIYQVWNYSNSTSYSKEAGNYNFVTSLTRRGTGRCTIGTVYPSGWTWRNTFVWSVGAINLSVSNSSNSILYCTLIEGYLSSSTYYWYANTADDASYNDGSFYLYFLCL